MTGPDLDPLALAVFADDPLAVDPSWLDLAGAEAGCADPACVDGLVPADTSSALGQLYQPCPICTTSACGECGGTALQPADPTWIEYLAEVLLRAGIRAALCPGCGGLLDPTAVLEATELVP